MGFFLLLVFNGLNLKPSWGVFWEFMKISGVFGEYGKIYGAFIFSSINPTHCVIHLCTSFLICMYSVSLCSFELQKWRSRFSAPGPLIALWLIDSSSSLLLTRDPPINHFEIPIGIVNYICKHHAYDIEKAYRAKVYWLDICTYKARLAL